MKKFFIILLVSCSISMYSQQEKSRFSIDGSDPTRLYSFVGANTGLSTTFSAFGDGDVAWHNGLAASVAFKESLRFRMQLSFSNLSYSAALLEDIKLGANYVIKHKNRVYKRSLISFDLNVPASNGGTDLDLTPSLDGFWGIGLQYTGVVSVNEKLTLYPFLKVFNRRAVDAAYLRVLDTAGNLRNYSYKGTPVANGIGLGLVAGYKISDRSFLRMGLLWEYEQWRNVDSELWGDFRIV